MIPILFLSLAITAVRTPPANWKTVKDSEGLCQIAVPPDWDMLYETDGAATFHDVTTAIAVVTSQPNQRFKPLPDNLLKLLAIPKDKLFENTPKRVFYQDKISRNPEEPNALSASVPGKTGTCSCHIVALPSIPEATTKAIALSLSPVAPPAETSGPAPGSK